MCRYSPVLARSTIHMLVGIEKLFETQRGRITLAALGIVAGAVFCYMGLPDLYDAMRLRRSSAAIDAEVTETRISRGAHGIPMHDLRYRFQVPGRTDWFTRQERGTRQKNLWSSVSTEEYEQARSSGRIRVVYVPDDPETNCPASLKNSSLGDAAFGFTVGTGMLLVGAFYLTSVALKRLVRRKEPVQTA